MTIGQNNNGLQRVDERLALAVFIKLMRATEAVSAAVHAPLIAEQLTISQFGVLEALFHCGTMCQKELAEKILKSSGNMTMVLDNLEKRGLVVRLRNLEDRRFISVQLTKRGREMIARIFPDHAGRIRNRMASLTRPELEQLEYLLRVLGTGGKPIKQASIAG